LLGNAVSKVKTLDKTKVLTFRSTSFPPAATEGGSAKIETAPTAETKSKASIPVGCL
jgi:electron transfer flavoprotein alpha subunit